MTATDQYDLALSTDSAAAAAAYVEGLELAQRLDPEAPDRFGRALEHDPHFALARAALAFQTQYHPDPAAGVGLTLFASNHARTATRREQQHVEVMRLVATRDWPAAAALASTHLDEHPRDVLVLWQRIRLLGYGGDPERKAKAAGELDRRAPAFAAGDPWYAGIHGFALSETGRLDEAERVAARGRTSVPDHPLPVHTLAHLAYERRDDEGGRAFLGDWLTKHRAGLVAGHLHWHLALTDVALGEPEVALERYRVGDAMQGPDAASLLWRLHLRGLDVAADMKGLLDEPLSAGLNATFVRAHQAVVCCALGDAPALDRLLQEHREDGLPGGSVFAAWVSALRAIADGHWAGAVNPLELVCADVRALGGSNEQHDLFHETLAAARRRLPA